MNLFLTIVFTVWACCDLQGQTIQHSATLQWSDTLNPVGTNYSIYRSNGPCTLAQNFIKLVGPIAIPPVNSGTPTIFSYQDDTVGIGTYCYHVTATASGNSESTPSNNVQGTIVPMISFPPINLTITVK